jgi:hypothetical protein
MPYKCMGYLMINAVDAENEYEYVLMRKRNAVRRS